MLKLLQTKSFLLLMGLLLGVGSVSAQSDESANYTGNITLSTTGGTSASTCKVVIGNAEYAGIKAGTGSAAGAVKITVPANTKYLHLHVAGWNGENVTLSVTSTGYSSNITLTSNSGISGNSPFTFSGNPSTGDYYKVITFSSALSEQKTLTFAATSGKRFVVWGVTSEEEQSSPLSSIDVNTTNVKTEFYLGEEEFTHEGAVVTATYEDNTTKNVTSSAVFTAPDMTTAGTKTVAVSYTEGDVTKTTSYNIEVKTRTLTSITLSGNYPTAFTKGDSFSTQGLVVTANYSEGPTKDVTSNATITAPDMTTPGTKTVTVSYTEGEMTKTATYYITVAEYVQPTQIEIALNDTFFGTEYNGTVSGITDSEPARGTKDNVTVIYAGSGNHYINNNQIRFYPSNKLTFVAPEGYNIKQVSFTANGTWAATISANGGSYDSSSKTWTGEAVSVVFTGSGSSRCDISKVNVTLEESSPLASIALSGTYPVEFNAGDVFSHEGMTVTSTYANGHTKDVTGDATFSIPDMTTTGTKTVTVSFTEGEVTKTATYEITVHEYVQPTQVTIALNNAFFGTSFAGANAKGSGSHTGISNNITVTFNSGGDTNNFYISDSEIRVYSGNTLEFAAPSGYYITNISFASAWASGTTTTPEGLNNSRTAWSSANGSASVAFNPTSRSDVTTVTVTIAPTITVTSAGWATFASSMNVSFNEKQMSAFVVTDATTTSATMQSVSTVPAETPVLVCAEPGIYGLSEAASATAPTKNLLQVSDGTVTGGDNIYSLAKIDNEVGFYRVASSVTIPAGRCYLNIQGTAVEGNARAFLSLGSNSETGITTVTTNATDGNIYDLTGRRVAGMAHGLYIVNGKKVVLK